MVLPRSRTGSSQVEAYQRKRTDVPGTATVPLGYKLRQQTAGLKYQSKIHCQTANAARSTGIANILAPIPTDPPRFHANLARDNPNLVLFGSSTEMEGNYRGKGLSKVSDINTRRERLHSVISSEEASLAREILNLPRTSNRAEEAAKRDEELRLREEKERRHLVTAKRKQQYFENCHDARSRISREIVRGVKFDNLRQIMERNSRRKEEKELDKLWYEVMAKEAEAQKRREEDEMRKRKMKEKETGLVLWQQMAEKTVSEEELKRRREEDKQELEKLWLQVREEEIRHLEAEKLKREKLRTGLEEQLVQARKQFEEKMKQEVAVAQKLKFISEVEVREEKKKIREAKIQLQKEIEGYMKYLEELKADQVKREEEVDAIIEQSARDIEARRDLARKRYKERQAKLRDEIIKVRDDQLKVKRDLEAEEKRRIEEERQLWRKDAQLAEAEGLEDVNKKKESAMRYRRELEAQLKQREFDKRRGIMEESEEEQKVLKEREEFDKFKEELVNRPDSIPVKAFRVMMKECARPEATRKFF